MIYDKKKELIKNFYDTFELIDLCIELKKGYYRAQNINENEIEKMTYKEIVNDKEKKWKTGC